MRIIEWFKGLPFLEYFIASSVMSLAMLIIYSTLKLTNEFYFEDYLISVISGWVLMFVLMIIFVLLAGEKTE